MKLVIVSTASAFNKENKSFTIGGVQTYIQDLFDIGKKSNSKCILALVSKEKDSTELEINGITIRYFHKKEFFKSLNQSTFDHVYKRYNSNDAVFVIATDQMSIKSSANNVITIQHGIAFDDELETIPRLFRYLKFSSSIYAHLRAAKNVQRGKNTQNIVCVDYNFFNWIRTLGPISRNNNYHIILNHTSSILPADVIEKKISTQKEVKSIIFARRFVDYRGTIIFANVIEKLFKRGRNNPF